jgi:hypothetical protein
MKRRRGALVIALYLLILSLLFAPLSNVSLSQFAKGLLIRSAIVLAFALVTSSFLDFGTVEPYRLTEVTTIVVPKGEDSPLDAKGTVGFQRSHSPRKQGRSHVAFRIVIAAIYYVTQTSWWAHQVWVGKTMETLFRWTILFACWGFLVLLWLPKPDANQPEQLHVVPSKRNGSAPSV